MLQSDDLCTMSALGHLECVEHLLESQPYICNVIGPHGMSALMGAAWNGHRQIVELLFEMGADVNQADTTGVGPLLGSIWNGHPEVATFLIEKGADVNQANSKGQTPLMLATIYANMLGVVKLLIEKGAPVNHARRYGLKPLIEAVSAGHYDIVALLLDNGAAVNQADFLGGAPLLEASRLGRTDLVELLLQNGADVDQANHFGTTPVMGAGFIIMHTVNILICCMYLYLNPFVVLCFLFLHGSSPYIYNSHVRLLPDISF